MDQKEYDQKLAALQATVKDDKNLRKRIRALNRRFKASMEGAGIVTDAKVTSSKDGATKRSKVVELSLVAIYDYIKQSQEYFESIGMVFEAEQPTLEGPEDEAELGVSYLGQHPTYWCYSTKQACVRGIEPEAVVANYKTRWGILPTHFTYMMLPTHAIGFRTRGKDIRLLTPKTAATS